MQSDFPLGWFAQKEMTNDGEKDRGKENKSKKEKLKMRETSVIDVRPVMLMVGL